MVKLLKLTLLPFLLLCGINASAQNVTWQSSVEHLDAGNYRIVFSANIPDGFHMYDLGPYELGGPNATTITFEPVEGVTFVGELKASMQPVRHFDKTFELEIGTYEGAVQFSQDVALTSESATVNAKVEWMICNDTSCLPPDDKDFTIKIGNFTSTSIANSSVEQSGKTDNSTLWALIIEAILWGFAALLTPCVFPMVPMTVSFFMKGEGGATRGRFRAFMYGFFIVALYTLPIAGIILITRFIGGDAVTADIFNWLATHWIPNVIFFLVFMIFAASFFGAFEITMPSWLVNKSDSKADSKGLAGIFFMALTLVLVSFSCTGPIVGSVLIKSTSGEFWNPIITMFAFSVAFALPFTIFAFFPSMLNKMPKSGGWLNSVKVVLGFIEVALGMKFLSVADQTYHWGLLDREIYLAVWIVVFSLLGLYLLGKLKFAHDSDSPYLGVGRLFLSIITFSFVVYLIPGMWGAPLKGLSGYMPPLHTQDFVMGAATQPSVIAIKDGSKPKYSDFLHLPHDLEGFFELRQAEAYATEVGKPLFIDFTGHGCVNCREMEARVWSDPRVLNILRNDYVIVALYSDDKKVLPQEDWVTTESGKVLKSLGKINSHYALTTYGVNAQPYYIIQGRDGKVLIPPRGYDLNVDNFIEFLKRGVKAYKEQ